MHVSRDLFIYITPFFMKINRKMASEHLNFNASIIQNFQIYKASFIYPYYQSNSMETNKKNAPLNSADAEEARKYFQSSVKPLFSGLIENIIKSKPEDITEYCMQWFRDNKGESKNAQQDSQNEINDIVKFQTVSDDVFEDIKIKRLEKGRKKRYGVSSDKNSRGSIKIENGQKKQETTYMRILFFCMNSFLFRNFTQKQIGQLIQKMKMETYQANKQVCRQGQYGDRMYLVDKGIFQCRQQTQEGTKSIKNYLVGDTFGQICLLHMIKRQASIICRHDGILYSLDRESYIHFKKMSMIKKRTLYLLTLTNQKLFSSFTEEKLQKICDVLMEASYQEGQLVINEGDVGTKFYIILDGILVAYKGKQSNVIQCYKEGDSFGEVALIKDTPRHASVKTLTRCRLVYMTREIFRRIFENVNLEKQLNKYGSKGNHINNVNKRRINNSDQVNGQKQIYQKRGSIKIDKISIEG